MTPTLFQVPESRPRPSTFTRQIQDTSIIYKPSPRILGIILLPTLRGLTQDEQLMSQHDEMQSAGVAAPEDTTRMENRDTEPAEPARYRRPMPPHHPRTNPSCGHLRRLQIQIQLLAIVHFAQAPTPALLFPRQNHPHSSSRLFHPSTVFGDRWSGLRTSRGNPALRMSGAGATPLNPEPSPVSENADIRYRRPSLLQVKNVARRGTQGSCANAGALDKREHD